MRLGYVHNGRYYKLSRSGRGDVPLVSDLPNEDGSRSHHGWGGRNVLLIDGRVIYLRDGAMPGAKRQAFASQRRGPPRAGLGQYDDVLVHPAVGPRGE